ncbi:DUF6903 family protein [Filifactor villosus]|uniref:DUF6903 family protein n=1 Tax=Filifactor villosus TaxID=29374 RepID=A0ABV9QIU0_9FIRM
MDIYAKKKRKRILMALAFLVGVALQVAGQRREGYEGLLIQLLSLVILLVDLYIYNRQYR